MTSRKTLAALVCCCFLSGAFGTELSSTTNDLYVAIGGSRSLGQTNVAVQFDDTLIWMPFCETGRVELSYPLAPEYLVRVKMTDKDGKEVAKTHLGARFGSKFGELRSVTDTRPYPFLAFGSYRENHDLGGGRHLVQPNLRPLDLFDMKSPGLYTLEIQMQMFRPVPRSTNAASRDLFQFPAVRLRVEKPAKRAGATK